MTVANATRVQITTTYTSNYGVGRIRATVNTGEHARKYVTLPYAHSADYAERHLAAVTKLTKRLGLTGAITYAGTTNLGGTVYNVAI